MTLSAMLIIKCIVSFNMLPDEMIIASLIRRREFLYRVHSHLSVRIISDWLYNVCRVEF